MAEHYFQIISTLQNWLGRVDENGINCLEAEGKLDCRTKILCREADRQLIRTKLNPCKNWGNNLTPLKDGSIRLPDGAVESLADIISSFTCEKHKRHKTYHACSLISNGSRPHFFRHMDWDMDNWTCLAAQDDGPCDEFSAIYLGIVPRSVDISINRLALGDKRLAVVETLVRHLLCAKHRSRMQDFVEIVRKRSAKFLPRMQVSPTATLFLDSDAVAGSDSDVPDDAVGPIFRGNHSKDSRRTSISKSPTPRRSPRIRAGKAGPPSKGRIASSPFLSEHPYLVTLQRAVSNPDPPPSAKSLDIALGGQGTEKGSRSRSLASVVGNPASGLDVNEQRTPGSWDDEWENGSTAGNTRSIDKKAVPMSRDNVSDMAEAADASCASTRGPDRASDQDDVEGAEGNLQDSLPGALPSNGLDSERESTSPEDQDQSTIDGNIAPEFQRRNDNEQHAYGVIDSVLKTMECSVDAKQGQDFGYVYILKMDDHPGYVKIGRTTLNVKTRRAGIQKWVPWKLTVLSGDSYQRVPYHKRIEQLVKDELYNERRRLKGGPGWTPKTAKGGKDGSPREEWYEISEDGAIRCVERWKEWMRLCPYDEDGRLRNKWRNRTGFSQVTKSQQDQLLREHWTDQRWHSIMEPSALTGVRIGIYSLWHQERRSRMASFRGICVDDVYENFIPCCVLYVLIGGIIYLFRWAAVLLPWQTTLVAHWLILALL